MAECEQTLAQAVQPQQSSLFSSFIISQYAAFYADDFSLYKQTFTTSASNIIYHEACIAHEPQGMIRCNSEADSTVWMKEKVIEQLCIH